MAEITTYPIVDSLREAPLAEEDDDEFVDVDESYGNEEIRRPVNPSDMTLEESIDVACRAVDLFFNNKFSQSKELMEAGKKASMYHALGFGTFAFMQAVMTMNAADLETAIAALKSSVEVCGGFRKRESVKQTVTKMVRGGKKYSSYSEEERHAELCYAEGILERAVLTFLEDETLSCFVKGALQIRHGYYAYRECWNILKEKPAWKNDKLKDNFESGVRLGVGAFNLLISMLPARILKILEWIGFTGTKELGLSQLDKSYESDGALRRILSAMVLLGYHTFICFFIGIGDGDVVRARQILEEMLARYPNGAFFLFFSGRLELVTGNVQLAITQYTKSIESQDEWIQFHHFCTWELMWCNVFLCNWDGAADHALRLLKESKWSRCVYAYCRASALCMKSDPTEEEKKEINELMTSVPKWKQRIAGKSLPIEKYSVRKSSRYFAQNGRLVLPAFELMFVWNGFALLSKRRDLLDIIYSQVQKTLADLEEDTSMSANFKMENICLCKVLSGCCLRWMQLPNLAEEHLEDALKFKLEDDKYLLPYAAAELGLLYMSLGDMDKARRQLEFARTNYTNYSLESRLHFRVHVALNKLNEMEKKDQTL